MSEPRPASLLISLPPSEWDAERLPGSLFTRQALEATAVSPELNGALDAIEAECRRAGMTPVYVARPEIFAHGAGLDWLKSRVGDARDHIDLSDGVAVRRAAGFGNYVFFYGRERLADAQALASLAARAPDMLAALDGQINSALRFGGRCPPPLALGAATAAEPRDVALFRLWLRPFAADSGVASMLAAGEAPAPARRFAQLTYVPLTEPGLASPGFVAQLADRLAAAAFDPTQLWILRPPPQVGASRALEARLEATLGALAGSGRGPPAAPLPTVWAADGDMGAAQMRRLGERADLLLHESCEVWRRPPDFYAGFRSIAVAIRPSQVYAAAFAALMRELTGRAPDRIFGDDDASARERCA